VEAQAEDDRAADARASPRTNLFLAAVLHGPGYSAPVKVRNMSATGALLEAAAVPHRGAAIRLVRGSLAISGIVVWSAPGRCGLHFSSFICVREWMAPPANGEQQRVDEAVRLLKAGAIPLSAVANSTSGAGSKEFGGDLRNVARLLETLAEHLIGNEVTLLAHGAELQNLDIAVQTLNAVASALGSESDSPALFSRIENLRTSCHQALARGG